MNPTNSETLTTQLKALWGASRLPGFPDSSVVVNFGPWQESLRRLHQLIAVRACGLLHGPHGVGKSFLIHQLCQELSPKQYRVLRLVHSSLMGSDLLRQLVHLGGGTSRFRRSDNIRALNALWQQWSPLWPVVIVEEAQDLSTQAMEELRLLTCERADTQAAFSLILVGDEDLLPRLSLGINRALVSRLGFCLPLSSWPLPALRDYLQRRLSEVGLHTSPLEPAAEELLLQSAGGIPRNLNSLLQRAMETAALAQRRNVTAAEVQGALDTLPWLTRAPAPSSSSA
jgi:general secretion pathway protein A